MLEMLHVNRNLVAATNFIKLNRRLLSTILPEEEYTATPQYPPILDLSPQKVRERRKAAVHDEIKNVKTVEEKQIKLNMPKYYGFKCYIFKENFIPFNSLTLAQHITRTHVSANNTLPEFYNIIDADALCQDIKADVEEALVLEFGGIKRSNIRDKNVSRIDREDAIGSHTSKQVNRIIMNKLSHKYPHLKTVQVDYDSRIESFWFAGGMNPPDNIKRYRKANKMTEEEINEPTDRAIQYFGFPTITLRSTLPLPSIIPYSEATNQEFNVPYFKYDPHVMGTTTEHRHAVNTPGFWPGDPAEFGLISYHNRGYLSSRQFNDITESIEAKHRQAILASYGWLQAQANFLGFTTFNDITYPLVTQAVITNGQLWSIYIYQLNTLLVHSKHTNENPKINICWTVPEMKLFEKIENNKVVGLNENVLKMLIKLYANAPVERVGVEMRPYLNKKERVSANYEDEDKREWLEREYKFLVSNRNRYKPDYEIYAWEKIYKIDHKTRPMDKKLRPFELGIKPSDRTLDDRKPFYIPRALRPDLPRHKGRYKKEYFP